MRLQEVYEMPVDKENFTKYTPHNNCVRATILHISKPIPRGKWWKQVITVVDETLQQEVIYYRTEHSEALLVRGKDEGKEAIFRLKAYIGEYAEFLSGYPKELFLDEKGSEE